MLILVGLLGTASLLAVYCHYVLLDTDRYTATVTPLADNPVLQAAVADQATTAIINQANLRDRVAEQATPIVRAAVGSFLASSQFAGLWESANRQAHRHLVAVLRDDSDEVVRADDDGTLRIDFAPFTAEARDQLIEAGVSPESLPSTSIVVARGPDLTTARQVVRGIDIAAVVLPPVNVLLALAAVVVAPRGRRWRAVTLVGMSVAFAVALATIVVAVARWHYLSTLPSEGPASATVVEIIADALLEPLTTLVRAMLLIAAGIMVVGIGGNAIAARRARALAA
ncbi:hypothetical protein GCM10011591_41820 [Nocardia camponoti]|uniref:Uncharacterized protein n=1 Tax=Nocardia camponoti TaxID=1616106 RepID=A0A917QSH1_9NOCA|nr:hypothetical protein GCM10011591_41820 [Nocardia camponoti]